MVIVLGGQTPHVVTVRGHCQPGLRLHPAVGSVVAVVVVVLL